MTPLQRIDAWLSRRPDGSLRYPRTVRAHIDLIIKYAPHALSEAEVKLLSNNRYYDET